MTALTPPAQIVAVEIMPPSPPLFVSLPDQDANVLESLDAAALRTLALQLQAENAALRQMHEEQTRIIANQEAIVARVEALENAGRSDPPVSTALQQPLR